MKSLKAVFCVFAVIVFVLSAASFASTARSLDRRGEKAEEHTAVREQPPERVYIVRREGDAVCVWERGSDEPLGKLAIDPRGLPESDRMLLECGILAEGDAQLLALIEDYGS